MWGVFEWLWASELCTGIPSVFTGANIRFQNLGWFTARPGQSPSDTLMRSENCAWPQISQLLILRSLDCDRVIAGLHMYALILSSFLLQRTKCVLQEKRRALGRRPCLYCALRRAATLARRGTKNGGWKPPGAEFRFGTCLFKCLQQRKPWWIVWKLRRTATQVSASSSDQTGEHLDG